MTPRATKLLALALDAGATKGESEAAACALIRHWRTEGVTAESLLAPDTRPAKLRNDRMPWGQYKNVSLADIAREDANYLEWVLENCARLRPGLRKAIVAALAAADRNR
jgi:hypothetical protein